MTFDIRDVVITKIITLPTLPFYCIIKACCVYITTSARAVERVDARWDLRFDYWKDQIGKQTFSKLVLWLEIGELIEFGWSGTRYKGFPSSRPNKNIVHCNSLSRATVCGNPCVLRCVIPLIPVYPIFKIKMYFNLIFL